MGTTSECDGACAAQWPPLTGSTAPTVGAGADAAIGALVVSYGRSLFGWQEVGFRTPIELAVLTELGAAIVLAAALTGTAVLAVARSR